MGKFSNLRRAKRKHKILEAINKSYQQVETFTIVTPDTNGKIVFQSISSSIEFYEGAATLRSQPVVLPLAEDESPAGVV